MKHILTLGIFLLLIVKSFAQTDGISYQAVIIAPDVLELPGVDSEGNYLPNATILVKFIIFNSGNAIEFEEIQTATTDEFGRINLIIGSVEHDEFEAIEWDGTGKDLKVEIDFQNGNGYVDMSREILTFVPYAYHRNITATGTLDVDGDTFLNRELAVNGPTTLNSTLDVTGGNETYLSGDLTVDGITNLENTLNVNNQSVTNLSGALNVGSAALRVDTDAPTTLNGTLDVYGDTTVANFEATGASTFNELTARTLQVNESTVLDSLVTIGNSYTDIIGITGELSVNSNKQVKITSSIDGDQDQYDINNYPLLVEGGKQGIAIKVNAVGAKNENNFISFWDETPVSTSLPKPPLEALAIQGLFNVVGLGAPFEGYINLLNGNANTVSGETLPDVNGPMLWGRIEGETNENEFTNNADYNLDRLGAVYDVVDGTLDLVWQTVDVAMEGIALAGSSADVRPCVGFGACVTSPGPAMIAANVASLALAVVKELAAIANEVFAVRNLVVFDYNKSKYRGVSYASGAGDYAEYLLRENRDETMSYGDIVGVNGGRISKNTDAAQRMMVVSYKPIVLGALPQPQLEKFYEKVAFMGQVPVKVYGKVNIGDYILPSGNNDGLGIAVSPAQIKPRDIKKIVGVAWEAIETRFGFNYVNVSVGLNSNDTSPFIEKLEEQFLAQANEISDLKKLLKETINRLSVLENNLSNNKGDDFHIEEISSRGESADGRKYEIENDIIYFEITDADIENGLKLAEKMMQDDGINTSNHVVWQKINEDANFKIKITNAIKSKFENQIHYHKEINKKSGN
ncbi:MAG: hypothetical protein NWQ07_09355 [Flaviramulus sp.]|nr:hypothetical protein [Flaviramulus sp.]